MVRSAGCLSPDVRPMIFCGEASFILPLEFFYPWRIFWLGSTTFAPLHLGGGCFSQALKAFSANCKQKIKVRNALSETRVRLQWWSVEERDVINGGTTAVKRSDMDLEEMRRSVPAWPWRGKGDRMTAPARTTTRARAGPPAVRMQQQVDRGWRATMWKQSRCSSGSGGAIQFWGHSGVMALRLLAVAGQRRLTGGRKKVVSVWMRHQLDGPC
ncbi:1,4-beta-D-glucan glucohydrolase [Sesbania bispinosa]|nr:1,4-beta-D-glucan glucohydrolase [Sesbania bispinosa]